MTFHMPVALTRSLTLTTACFVAGAASAQANVVINGSFESPDASADDVADAGAPWANFGAGGTRFTSADFASDGSQSLKLFGPFDQLGNGTGVVQNFPAIPGQTWVANADAYTDMDDALGEGNFLAFKIEFLDAGGALAAGGNAGVDIFEVVFDESQPVDTWVPLGVGTAPAPANTASVNVVAVHVQAGTSITGGSVYVDNVRLTVPEPASALLGLGGLALIATRRRRHA